MKGAPHYYDLVDRDLWPILLAAALSGYEPVNLRAWRFLVGVLLFGCGYALGSTFPLF